MAPEPAAGGAAGPGGSSAGSRAVPVASPSGVSAAGVVAGGGGRRFPRHPAAQSAALAGSLSPAPDRPAGGRTGTALLSSSACQRRRNDRVGAGAPAGPARRRVDRSPKLVGRGRVGGRQIGLFLALLELACTEILVGQRGTTGYDWRGGPPTDKGGPESREALPG